jgi:uncharacterized membrane protein
MTPSYVWFLFLHITAALWVASGIFGSTVVRAQGKRTTSLVERGMAARLLWRLHVVFTLPGVVLAGLLGFYLVTAGGFRFNETWVVAAALLYLLLLLSTLFLVTPGLGRQRKAAEAVALSPAGEPALAQALASKLPGILSDVNATLLVILVVLMVVKP